MGVGDRQSSWSAQTADFNAVSDRRQALLAFRGEGNPFRVAKKRPSK